MRGSMFPAVVARTRAPADPAVDLPLLKISKTKINLINAICGCHVYFEFSDSCTPLKFQNEECIRIQKCQI